MMTKRKHKRGTHSPRAIFSLAVLIVLTSSACLDNRQRPERLYTVYANLTPKPTPSPRAPKIVVRPTPTPTPIEVEPKVDPLKGIVQERFAKVIQQMTGKGLLEMDIPRGQARLARIRELIKLGDYRTCQSLLDSFANDLNAITIDEAFITKKNDRLLELIQEKQPAGDVRAQIDAESEAINQLLEQADYAAINRRMNFLFLLLQKS